MPDDLTAFGPFAELEVDLTDTFKHLDCFAVCGRSGFLNSYLKPLARDFASEHAQSALGLLNRFATRYVNASLPPWFYLVFLHVTLVTPFKGDPSNRDVSLRALAQT